MTNMIHRFQTDTGPNSYDPTTRIFTVVLASNAALNLKNYDEVFDVKSIGLFDQIPLQADHSTSTRETLGEITNPRFETLQDGTIVIVADGRLASGDHTQIHHDNLCAGIKTGFSVSLRPTQWQESINPTTGRKTKTATAGKWIEGSFVLEPADHNAKIRGTKMTIENQEIETQVETSTRMTDEQFTTVCRAVNVPDDVIASLSASNADDTERLATARAAIPAQPVIRTATNHNDETLDNPLVYRNAVIEGLDAINRNQAPEGSAASVLAGGDRAIAERLCRNAGISIIGLNDSQVIQRAATTSDYPIIAGAVFNLSMRREYDAVVSPVTTVFGRDTVQTFNPETRATADWTPLQIDKKLENGNYKHSYIDESGEAVFVETLGGITSYSRPLSINSGNKLGNLGLKLGRRLAADVADRQVLFIEQADHAGPKMSDNKTVFHANRENIQVFTQAETTMIGELMKFRSGMAKRKGSGDVMIGVYPTYWLIHSDYEETALKLLATVQASAIADVNPLAGKLQVVVEPRLTDPDKSWLIADPVKMDGAVRVYLQGHEAPFTDSRINFDTDGLDFKIRHEFGLGWLEWRSWTRLDHVAAS